MSALLNEDGLDSLLRDPAFMGFAVTRSGERRYVLHFSTPTDVREYHVSTNDGEVSHRRDDFTSIGGEVGRVVTDGAAAAALMALELGGQEALNAVVDRLLTEGE